MVPPRFRPSAVFALGVLCLFASQTSLSSALKCDEPGEPWKGSPKGTQTILGDLNAYVTGDPKKNHNEKAVIIFLTDIYGWDAANNKVAADLLAEKSGLPVYIPDLFRGDKVTNYPNNPAFHAQHGFTQTVPLLSPAVDSIKALYGEDVRIGAAGFCWGARYSLILGARDLVDAVLACHPSRVNLNTDNLGTNVKPTLFQLAVTDANFAEPLKTNTISTVSAGGALVLKKEYAGVGHGFCVRCLAGDSACEKARFEAIGIAGEWFENMLKGGNAADSPGIVDKITKLVLG